MPQIFDSRSVAVRREYIVDKFLAAGSMSTWLSQAGVGKTYLMTQLAVSVATGKPFMGMPTKKMKVLYVNQDQASDDSGDRVKQCLAYHKIEETPNLITSFMEGLRLDDGSLCNTIKEVGAGLTIIDTLTSVKGRLNLNDSRDAGTLKQLYQDCINPHTAITFTHHISEHKKFGLGDIMTCDPGDLAMYSSVINQTMDGYYIVANLHKGEHARELYIRPVVKRYKIGYGISKTGLEQTDSTLHIKDLEVLDLNAADFLTSDEGIIINLFIEEKPILSVADVADGIKRFMTEVKARSVLASLEKKKYLVLYTKGHNRFEYEITDKGREAVKSEKGVDNE
jgi:hypothetical protein